MIREEVAGTGPVHPLPEAERQAGDSQSWKGAISAPETASSTKLRAGSQLLTESSWDPGRLTSARRVGAARDQFPRGEVTQTLASTTSKQGLNREARAALLRVRTRPECPEDNLRELT